VAKIVTVDEMRSIEKAADAGGLSYDQMMVNAGGAVAESVLSRMPDIQGRRVVVLAGSGNNGGDGLVAGGILADAGAQVSVYLAKSRPQPDEHLDALKSRDLLIAEAEQDQRSRVLTNLLSTADVVLDAIFGTGLKLPLKGAVRTVLATASKVIDGRETRPLIVAVDCPSGLDTDSGGVADEAISADVTVTLAAAKTGLLRFPGAERAGELIVADIGIPSNLRELKDVDLELATQDSVREWLPARPKDSHKGTFGQVVVIGGSIMLPGAAVLAGTAAYRIGAGLVTLAVPSSIQPLLAAQLPEATWILLPHEMGVVNELAVDVLVDSVSGSPVLLIGPGMGQDESASRFVRRLLGAESGGHRGHLGFLPESHEEGEAGLGLGACVFDADALKLLTEVEDWPRRLPDDSVLTPHPGEMAILTGEDKDALQADRVASAKKWAAKWGHVVVFKGAFTVVAAADGRVSVLPFATSALASAGTGDVLAGAIAGLRAQGVSAYESAVLGAFLHGLAGHLAGQMLGAEASVMAGDVISALPEAMEFIGSESPEV
jgi:hydroxyethylthiazole kinase-like uncharacterized protein yjeF